MKRFLAFFLLTCLLASSVCVQTTLAAADTTIFVAPTDFKDNLGTWKLQTTEDTSGSFDGVILAIGEVPKNTARSAAVNIDIPADGEYYVFARTRDYNTYQGYRNFKISLDEKLFDKLLGAHAENGWKWEELGSTTLKKGPVAIELVDTAAYYARCEGIIITTNKNFALPETKEAFIAVKKQYKATVLGAAVVTPSASISPAAAQPTSAPDVSKDIKMDLKPDKKYIVLDYNSFKDHMGNWELRKETDSMFGEFMFSLKKSDTNLDLAAQATFGIPEAGLYKIMVHTKDNSALPGTRSFKLKLGKNGNELEFGGHGYNGWKWESSAPLPFLQGEDILYAIDFKANYSRFDMLIITDDLDFEIGNNIDDMKKLQSDYIYKPGTITAKKTDTIDPNRPSDEIAVKFNGKYMTFDVPPVVQNGRTLVPFRAIFEALGCTVTWNSDSETAIGTRNGSVISLGIGNPSASVNGEVNALDQPAVLINGRTLVPLRFVSESMGAIVDWNENTKTVLIIANIPPATFLLRPESFGELGTWSLENEIDGAFNKSSMRGTIPSMDNAKASDAKPENTIPAIARINVSKEGNYRIWVRSRDFETNQQGSRFFNLGVNGTVTDKKFGSHGKTGFLWGDAGIFKLDMGENTIELHDTSGFFARCDAVLITENLTYIPPENYQAILALASPINPYLDSSMEFPKWAKSEEAPIETIEMGNDKIKVLFYKVPTSRGTVIQNEIKVNSDGEWITTKKRNEELGYLMIKADSSEATAGILDIVSFKNVYTVDGSKRNYLGRDVYKSGDPTWFIPTSFEQLSDKSIKLVFNDQDVASFGAVWELSDTDISPKVSIDVTFTEKGCYSIGVFEGKEFLYDEFEFAMIPFRLMSKQVVKEQGLISEQFSFTPMATITLPKNNEYISGKNVTKGVVVEPSWIPMRWVYRDNGKFGMAIKGAGGGYKGGVFAPAFGTKESNFLAGDTYNFQFRVLSSVSTWFENYKHVASDLFHVTDYREAYYTSLNDAIYNTTDLMMEDDLGGWDKYDKAYYNMESNYTTTNANPMMALQSYLLTENKDILERRVVPTIANILTRPTFHMNRTTNKAMHSWGKNEIGSPNQYYPLSVLGGMYEQTRGTLPWLLNYSTDVAKKGTVSEPKASVAPFMNDLSLYKYTGDKTYLDKAKASADEYLQDVVYAPRTEPLSWLAFVYSSYYPNLASLLDIYEVTKEQKYLDAAKYTGQWLSAVVWTPGVDGEKKNTPIIVNKLEDVSAHWHGGRENNEGFWWHGDVQWRQGSAKGNPADNQAAKNEMKKYETEVPAWVASRVGLGMEQPVTYLNSSNITMQCWAGDMVRLSKFTGEKYFETVARNAIIGRFGGYSGYYIQSPWTYYQTPQYGFKGPDYTMFYWHHLPPFLAMLQDFLINQIWSWSDCNIEFPKLRQLGYAYFNSNQYGHAPGKFFDQEDMWLWLDRDIVTPDNIQIDYLTARKDGVFGAAFINESGADITTQVTIGDKIAGGASYTGKATLYSADKSTQEIDVENGKFTLNMPAKGFKAIVIKLPEIKAPKFSELKYNYSETANIKKSVHEHENGKAFAIQMTPENYYAYVYITDTEDTTKSLKIKYTVEGGQEQSQTIDIYPYEFIIEVSDSSKSFTYTLEKTETNGSIKTIPGGTIEAIAGK